MPIDWEKEVKRVYPANPKKENLKTIDMLKVFYADFAVKILGYLPDCADKSACLRSLRESLHWANMSLAHADDVVKYSRVTRDRKPVDINSYDYMDNKGNIYKFIDANHMMAEVILEDITGNKVSLSINDVKPIPLK